jgi:hypothetical protein
MPSTKNSEAVHLAALMARQFIIMAKDIINPRISLSLVMESANAMSKVDPKVRRDNTHSTSFAEWKSNLQRSNRDRWPVHAALIDRAPPTSRGSPDARSLDVMVANANREVAPVSADLASRSR